MIHGDYEQLFSHLPAPEPSAGLFNRIILAIKHEQELRNTKRLAFGLLALFVILLTITPFSWLFFAGQMAESGVFQFLSIAVNDFGALISLWPDFVMAITESLPVAGITVFIVNIILAVFTLRLFLCRKRLLLNG